MKIKEFFENRKIEDLKKEAFSEDLFKLKYEETVFSGFKIRIVPKKSFIPSFTVNTHKTGNIYMSEYSWEGKLIEMMKNIKMEYEGNKIIKFYNFIHTSATNTSGVSKTFFEEFGKNKYEELINRVFFVRILTFAFLNKLMKDYLREYLNTNGALDELDFISKTIGETKNVKNKTHEALAENFANKYIRQFYKKIEKKISDKELEEFLNKNKYILTFKIIINKDIISLTAIEIFTRNNWPYTRDSFKKKNIHIGLSFTLNDAKNFFEKRKFQTTIFFESKSQIINEIKNLEEELNQPLNLESIIEKCK